MPANKPEAIGLAKALTAFKEIDFGFVAQIRDIYSQLKYDVPEINLNIKEKYNDILLRLINDKEPAKKSSLVLPIIGTAGSGKTHLLNYFYAQAILNSGFFAACEFNDAGRMLNDINIALADSLTESGGLRARQLEKLIENVLVESGAECQHCGGSFGEFVSGAPAEDRLKFIEGVLDTLYLKHRTETLNSSDHFKALVFLASSKLSESKKAKAWLQSGDTRELAPEYLQFDKKKEEPIKILRWLTWLMSLNGGFSVIVVDQMDSFQPNSGQSHENSGAGIFNATDLGAVLTKLVSLPYKTLPILSTHSDAWERLMSSILKSYQDRFTDPLYLGPIINPELIKKMVEKRLEPAYQKNDFIPPYPTWPFPKSFFESQSGSFSRDILRHCMEYIDGCAKSGRLAEWSADTIEGSQPTTETGAGLQPPDPYPYPYKQETKLYVNTAVKFKPKTIDTERKEHNFWKSALPALADCAVGEAGAQNIEIKSEFFNLAAYARLNLTTFIHGACARSLHILSVPDYDIDNFTGKVNLALNNFEAKADIKSTKTLIIRLTKLEAAESAVQTHHQNRNVSVVVPETEDIKNLKGLAAVKNEFPKTWQGWTEHCKPLKTSFHFLRNGLNWLCAEQAEDSGCIASGYGAGGGGEFACDASGGGESAAEGAGAPPSGSQDFLISIATQTSIAGVQTIPIASKHLASHFGVFGSSGSGKSVLLRRIIEEAAINHIPCVLTDTEGDLSNLRNQWPEKPDFWNEEYEEKAKQYFDNTEIIIWTPEKSNGNPFRLPYFKDLSDCDPKDTEELQGAITANTDSLQDLIGNKLKHYEKEALNISMRSMVKNNLKFSLPNLRQALEIIEENDSHPEPLINGAHTIKDLIASLELSHPAIEQGPFNEISELIETKSNKTRISIINLSGIHDFKHSQRIVEGILSRLYAYFRNKHFGSLHAMLVIDEAQKFIPSVKKAITSDIITKIFKEIRKYGVSAGLATQNISAVSTQVINNCGIKFIGKQTSSAAIKTAGDILGSPAGLNKLIIGEFILHYPDNETSKKSSFKVKTARCVSYAPKTAPHDDTILKMAQEAREYLRKLG
jgi:hypothetical protein